MLIRHDDFDWRMPPQDYIDNHERFIKADLIETVVVQPTQNGKLARVDPYLLNYMLTTTHWDFQLHGWSHNEYDKMSYDDVVRDLGASIAWMKRIFGRGPTVWYPPWNRRNDIMEKASDFFGLKIDNESNDIRKFIREKEEGTFVGDSVYFHLWNRIERDYIERMIELCK